MSLTKQSLFRYTEKVSFVALCITVINAVFFATANYTKELGFSVWSIAVLVTCAASVFAMVRNFKIIIKNPMLWILVAYGIWIVISAICGYNAGYNLGNIIEDIKRVVYFALFPVVLTVLNSESRIIKLMKIVVYSSLALSILTIVFFISYLALPELFAKLLHLGYYGDFINFTKISDTLVRILFVSEPLQLFGCAFAVYFLAKERQRGILYSVIIGLNLFCVLITFTRALYLATAVAALLAILLAFFKSDKQSRIMAVKRIAVAVVACAVLIVGFSVPTKTNYFGYAFQRVFAGGSQTEIPLQTPDSDSSSDDTEIPSQLPDEMIEFESQEEYLQATLISDNIRQNIKKMLQKEIDKNPLLGVGLGMRLPGRQTPPEYFYMDLWAKTGVVGLIFFLLPIGITLVDILKRIKRKQPFLISAFWCVGLIGLMVYSIYQPYMNTAPCVLMYCCTLCVNSWQKNVLTNAEQS